jgi:O-antigen/teichoic acid export membrane protein
MADLSPQNVTADETEVAIQPIHGIAGRLAQAFAIYWFANFGIRGLNFHLVVVYAHYLRPYDYGIIYMAEIIASFLMIFGGLSIDSALQRLYFQHDHDVEELRSYLGTAIRFALSWQHSWR